MGELRTDIVIGAKERGFAKIIEQIRKFTASSQKAVDSQTKGFAEASEALVGVGKAAEKSLKKFDTSEARNELKALEQGMKTLSQRQVDLHRALKGTKEGTDEYKKLNKELKESNKEMGRLGRHAAAVRGAMGTPQEREKKEQSKGAFTQGLLQGTMPGAAGFLQRGPGMRRQFAGQMTGRAMRGAPAAFSGIGGLASAIDSTGLPGGGLLRTSAGFVGQSLAHEKTLQGAEPFLGINAGQNIAQARRRGQAGVGGPAKAFASAESINAQVSAEEDRGRSNYRIGGDSKKRIDAFTEEMLDSQAKSRTRERTSIMGPGAESGIGGRVVKDLVAKELTREGVREKVAAFAETDTVGREREMLAGKLGAAKREELEAPEKAHRARKKDAGDRAAAAERVRLFGGIQGAGVDLAGINKTEAVQRASAMAQAGGGGLKDLNEQGLLRTGMAAQTRFGVGGDVSGAFLQAGRRGGLTGGVGLPGGPTGGDEMTAGIADALSLGLEGSEITSYMQQMAAGINQWKTTGIPFNRTSMRELTGAMGDLGMGGVRGGAVAAGVGTAAERVAGGGAQSIQDLMILETLGGFKGGGLQEMQDAMIKLEEKSFEEGDLKNLLTKFADAGGGAGTAGGQLAIGDILKSIGVNVGRGEAKEIGQRLAGGENLSNEDITAYSREEGRRGQGAKRAGAEASSQEALQAAASGMVGSGQKRQAANENRQMAIGRRMTGAVQDLERSASNVNTAFTNLVDGPLKAVTEQISDFSEAFPQAIETMKRVAAGMVD